MADLRLSTVKDEAGVSQGLILDHLNGQRVAMNGSAVTSAGLASPLAWVKNLGPGTVYLRGDGTAAGINQAGSYVLYSGQDWALAADNGARTISLAGATGTTVSVIPAKAVTASSTGGGTTSGVGFTDADVDSAMPTPSDAQHRPDVAKVKVFFKKLRAAVDATLGSVPWGAITGSIAAQADLVAAFATKSDVGHTHNRTALLGFGTAAALNVPAAGQAAANEVVKGDDPRVNPGTWAPLVHTQDISTVNLLQAALDNLRVGAGSFTFALSSPAVGTYEVEEYAEAAGTLTHVTDRLATGSASYRVQVAGTDVPGLGTAGAPLAPGATQTRRAATGSGVHFTAGQRTQVVVSAVTTPGVLLIHFRRTLD